MPGTSETRALWKWGHGEDSHSAVINSAVLDIYFLDGSQLANLPCSDASNRFKYCFVQKWSDHSNNLLVENCVYNLNVVPGMRK